MNVGVLFIDGAQWGGMAIFESVMGDSVTGLSGSSIGSHTHKSGIADKSGKSIPGFIFVFNVHSPMAIKSIYVWSDMGFWSRNILTKS